MHVVRHLYQQSISAVSDLVANWMNAIVQGRKVLFVRLYTIPMDNKSWMMDSQYSSLISLFISLMRQYSSLRILVLLVPAKANCMLLGVRTVELVLLHATTLRCLNLSQIGSLYREYVLPTKNMSLLRPLELYGSNLPMPPVYQNLFCCRTYATFLHLHITCSPSSSLHVGGGKGGSCRTRGKTRRSLFPKHGIAPERAHGIVRHHPSRIGRADDSPS